MIYWVLNKITRFFYFLTIKCQLTNTHEAHIINSTEYNMMTAPNESYYAEQYGRIIMPYIFSLNRDLTILDLGCGQGRLTILLAENLLQAKIIGCDISKKAIDQARNYSKNKSLKNIEWRVQSIQDCIEGFPEKSADVVLMTEVTFFYPKWESCLKKMIEILKDNGLLIMSFRPQYFNALCLVKNRLMQHIELLIHSREGRIFGPSIIFTWITSKEICDLLVDKYGLELIELRGIGVCSGIPGDPHDVICQPSQLIEEDKERLMNLELELGKTVPDAGRYILAIARKRHDKSWRIRH
ncbi:MAG: methyltransferase domain-containing protein [Syntrophorhabdaceae bacterium]|nr:methyltransferase domain-containing protein [Syntrophorhabdaceae bacterium]